MARVAAGRYSRKSSSSVKIASLTHSAATKDKKKAGCRISYWYRFLELGREKATEYSSLKENRTIIHDVAIFFFSPPPVGRSVDSQYVFFFVCFGLSANNGQAYLFSSWRQRGECWMSDIDIRIEFDAIPIQTKI